MVVLCMMAKAPVAGEVKTRLCPPLSHDHAAELAHAFIEDSWEAMQRVPDVVPALAYSGDVTLFSAGVTGVAGQTSWPQVDGDLGERIAGVIKECLARADAAIVVGSDSPGLPAELISHALTALNDHDAVLGPSEDGGYYLIGCRRWIDGMLSGLPWSSSDTLAATSERLRELGLKVAHTPTWFDVDDETDLRRLARAIRADDIQAPATRRLLDEWQWR